MNTLTFKGYVKDYLVRMSNYQTFSIASLCKEAKTNPRLIPILITYCRLTDKTELLERTAKKYKLKLDAESGLDKEKFMEYIRDKKIGTEYEKIFTSYENKKNKISNERKLISQIRRNVIVMQKDKKISNYCIYNKMHLNPGNINCWLKNDDSSKISLATAIKVSEFLESF